MAGRRSVPGGRRSPSRSAPGSIRRNQRLSWKSALASPSTWSLPSPSAVMGSSSPAPMARQVGPSVRRRRVACPAGPVANRQAPSVTTRWQWRGRSEGASNSTTAALPAADFGSKPRAIPSTFDGERGPDVGCWYAVTVPPRPRLVLVSTKVKRKRPLREESPDREDEAASSHRLPVPGDPRCSVILRAAFDTFVEHGVSGATTEEIARRARVSKREIYRLFGSKEALFAELVRERAGAMSQALAIAPAADRASALDALEHFGREFLALLTDPTTVAVYRLAIAEASRLPALGRQLDAQGRGTVWAVLTLWMAEARKCGALPVPEVERAAGSFMALLMADLPVRAHAGRGAHPSAAELAQRAALARAAFTRLWLG